jgi:sarcosine oxidase subunit beta
MNAGPLFDVAVVGGGVMGATTALTLAGAGLKVVLADRGGVGQGASGVNAGTLSLFYVEPPVVPYARRGRELWGQTREWLGAEVGVHDSGVLTLAFTDDEAELLHQRMAERRDQGADNEIIGSNRAREIEPHINGRIVLASYSPLEGMASSNMAGRAFRQALAASGVDLREGWAVTGADREGGAIVLKTPKGVIRASRVVLAGGAWSPIMARWFGVELPFGCYVNQVSVTERRPEKVHTHLGVVKRKLTLKQAANGSFLIGGGWQGIGGPESAETRIIPSNLVGNVRLAQHVLPCLKDARIVRTWLGLQDKVIDNLPVVGQLPGVDDVFILACGLSGFTTGPIMGRLMAQVVLGQTPELPVDLFNPARLIGKPKPGFGGVDDEQVAAAPSL